MKITITTPEIKDLEKRLAEEKDRAEAWELRCGELEQELRDAQGQLDESVRKEARLGLEAGKLRKRNDELTADLKAKLYNQTVVYEKEIRELRDRIGEQNWTIGCYDQENGELRGKLANAEAKRDDYHQRADCLWDENVKLHRQIEKLENENAELRAALTSKTQEVNGLQGTVAAQRVWFCGGQLQINKNTFNDWAKRIHRIAVDHGWWESEDGKCDDGDRPFPEIVALCHSELSEALEEYRNGKPMAYINGYWPKYDTGMTTPKPIKAMQLDEWEDDEKPEGIAVEMIDCIIRILDWLGHEGIDVDTLMEKKVKYNEGREHRHGGKKA